MDEKAEVERETPREKMIRSKGPGPKYLLPSTVGYVKHDGTRYRNPAWSMGHRLDTRRGYVTPGPKYKPADNVTRFGSNKPAGITMGSRLEHAKRFQTPGPDAYSPELHPHPGSQNPPAWSLAKRLESSRRHTTPGPNQYRIPTTIGRQPAAPDTNSAPAFAMGVRLDSAKRGSGSPGPAGYPATPATLTKTRPPAYSMGHRFPPPGARKVDAGFQYPGDYTWKRPPAFSFGARHSEFSDTLRLPADDDYPTTGPPRKVDMGPPCAPKASPPLPVAACTC
ncbi:ciliary microtubule associated protein 1A-like isoform X1 [Bacillus rossius redtenbacheri]|uniref:ciliary microtubule associated protein 1A-like isoform X1 n=1 Tax=Bacillus rossius redtenbacheri TaxID=93214 RepID=UPI002FDEB64F